jgi:AcrR family transcriptional regulator
MKTASMLPAAPDSGKAGAGDTRVRILAATRALYASKGSRGTTTRQVADRAEVNEATVFRHFGTKQQLLGAMLEHYTGESQFPEAFERAKRCTTIEEQLCVLGQYAVEAMRRKEDLIKVALAEEITNPEGTTCCWRVPSATRERLTQFFAEKVAVGELHGEPTMLGLTFMSLFFSYVMARMLWAELADTPQEQIVAVMVGTFLNGARAK